jgi:hypothetical protein
VYPCCRWGGEDVGEGEFGRHGHGVCW